MQAGRPLFGSEVNWPGMEAPATGSSTGTPSPVAWLFSTTIVGGAYNLIFPGSPTMPNIDTFGYTDASFYGAYLAPNHPLYDATNPDLSAFKQAGGKLILWHGWAEQHTAPDAVTTYKVDTMGVATVARPVYPYPAVAQLTTTGDWHRADGYTAGAPLYNVRMPAWAGASFYTPKVQGVAAP